MRARKGCISSTGLFVKKRDLVVDALRDAVSKLGTVKEEAAAVERPMAVNVKKDAVSNKVIRICKKLGTEFEPP